MIFKLRDVNGWAAGTSCTLTALSALSGKTPNDIAALLGQIATEHGRPLGPEPRDDYSETDWLVAVNRLGGSWAPGNDYSSTPYPQRPTIDEWMASNLGVEPELVVCDNGADIAHVFATEGGQIVDDYTKGKSVKFTSVDPDFAFLRVKRTFLVNP